MIIKIVFRIPMGLFISPTATQPSNIFQLKLTCVSMHI